MNNPTPVYESPVKLIVVELKLDGELDDDDVGGLGLDLTGLVGGLGGDEGEGGESGPGEVVAVLGSRKRLEGAGKGKNLLGHSEELGDPRLVGQAAQGGAWCVQNFSFCFQKLSRGDNESSSIIGSNFCLLEMQSFGGYLQRIGA